MNSLVVNTLTGAVSEYDSFDFDSVAGGYAGSATGLYTLGGELDVDQPIVASVRTGRMLWGTSTKKRIEMVFFAIRGTGTGELTVVGETDEYAYTFELRDTGVSRCPPGKGIRENYLAFGFRNPDGDDFRLDKIEVAETQAANRRTA